ncbi:hypothetical protein [Bacillus wiedmannii]|uniref:hypothetical protein n=1 Tax=Bacillus wiedmannii TaxID=1890302 RepID=UPI000BF2942C|nr:hypothetical protein [Bacillus wiedmannii]PEU23944.1 hypothetical protein CN532_23510 [Bacillus wiedmannii]PGD54086.1 hypothetical protein COM40_22585 [Bacillus wiedmannii]
MSNIYQEIWDADMLGNGIQPTFNKDNVDNNKGYVLVEPTKVRTKEEKQNHMLIKEVHIPNSKIQSYDLVKKLFNNFFLNPHLREDNTVEEQKEVDELLKYAIQSNPMKLCRTFVETKKGTSLSDEQWYTYLHNIWFLQFNSKSGVNLSGFEHVFVGEKKKKGSSLNGYHFWYKYYLEDQLGENDKITYLGPRDKNSVPDVITFAFTLEASDAQTDSTLLYKPKGGFFIGISPEGLLALGAARFADTLSEHHTIELNNQNYDLVLYSFGKRSMRTFFPMYQ